MSAANTIKVVARFRPQNRVELESGGQPIVKFEGDDTVKIDVRLHASLLSQIFIYELMMMSPTVQGGTRLLHLRPSI